VNPPAFAEESSYCRKVEARAKSDAALLVAPSVGVQGIRFPRGGQLDTGNTVKDGYQARAFLSFSPLNFYKGRRVLKVGDADCTQQAALNNLSEFISFASDAATLSALRKQIEYLQAHQGDWRKLSERASTRLSQRVITLVDFDDMTKRANLLERKLAETQGTAKRMETRFRRIVPGTLAHLEKKYAQSAQDFEREVARLRNLEPWHVQFTGGMVQGNQLDWYGLAELSFNLGGLVRNRYESQYVSARASEIATARYETLAKSQQLRAELTALAEQLQLELSVVEQELQTLKTTRAMLEKSESEEQSHARDTIALEYIITEADAVYLRGLSDALQALLKEKQQ
jgi:hypothetical protein